MIKIQPSTLEQCRPMFDEYIESISGVRDDFWEEHVFGSRIYRIEMDGKHIGITGIFNSENLTLFYTPLTEVRNAQPAFSAVLDELRPQYAFAPTNDELLLSLCMDKHISIDKQAYFFKLGDNKVRPPEFGREYLRLAEPSDIADILDTEGVEENIRLGKYYVMYKDGVFLGQGFFNLNRFTMDAASIGMSVHPDHRQKGVGRSIILHLNDICREKGITPNCGCWYYNHNSKHTLESAGFITKTRLLKVWFVVEKKEDSKNEKL